MKFLLTIFAIAAMQILSVSAQENSRKITDEKNEKVVPIIKQIGSRYFRCYNENEVFQNAYEAERGTKGGDKCINPVDVLKVDFEKQTLISFTAGGDCFMQARAKVFRNDATKTFRVNVMKKYGGCRAGGFFDGWLVIDKISADYKVGFSEAEVKDFKNDSTVEPLEEILNKIEKKETIQTRQYELDRCVQIYGRDQKIIGSKDDFLKSINGAHRSKECLKIIENIDFKKEILVGATIYSGYCQYPLGLKYELIRSDREKNFAIFVTYNDPYGRTCRALGMYDLWLAVPKPPENYEIKVEVASVLNGRYEY